MFFNRLILSVLFFVEPAGVEPASKRGSNMLSTCLSSLNFSCADKTEATNQRLILWIFAWCTRLHPTISDFAAPPYQRASERRHLGDVLSPPLGRD